MLNEIKEKLTELIRDEKIIEKYGNMYGVYYGSAHTHDKKNPWDYIVFKKNKVKKGGTSNTDLTYYWSVIIIREEYIPEGLETAIIDKILEINGLRLADNEFQYDYILKPNTNMVIELLELDFVKTKKRCDK